LSLSNLALVRVVFKGLPHVSGDRDMGLFPSSQTVGTSALSDAFGGREALGLGRWRTGALIVAVGVQPTNQSALFAEPKKRLSA